MGRIVVLGLFFLWLALVAFGAYVFATTEPADSGFTRGLNRAGELFKWQGAALGVAILTWIVHRGLGGSIWAGRLPLFVSGGFFLLVVLLFAGAAIFPQ